MLFRSGISRSRCDYAGLLSRFGTLRCAAAGFKTRTEADLDRVFLTDERSKRPVLPGSGRVIGSKDMIRFGAAARPGAASDRQLGGHQVDTTCHE